MTGKLLIPTFSFPQSELETLASHLKALGIDAELTVVEELPHPAAILIFNCPDSRRIFLELCGKKVVQRAVWYVPWGTSLDREIWNVCDEVVLPVDVRKLLEWFSCTYYFAVKDQALRGERAISDAVTRALTETGNWNSVAANIMGADVEATAVRSHLPGCPNCRETYKKFLCLIGT